MNNKNIEVKVEKGVKTLELRTGEALKLKEPKKVEFNGLIHSPFRYLEKRSKEIELKKSFISVNRDKKEISLNVDECNPYGTIIKGSLKINPDFTSFKINTGESRTTYELAEFIKMNRSFFETKDKAIKIATELRNFKATVDKEIENTSDNRANTKSLLAQTVESNIPESFKLDMPIFKGSSKTVFEVEIYINPNDFSCTLISPDCNDEVINVRDGVIDEQINKIEKLTKELLIIEE